MSELWLPVVLAFLLGGVVKGAVGLGMPTVVLGALVAYMPLSQAAALLVIPSLVTNIWQLFAGPRLWHMLLRFTPLIACLALGTLVAPIGMAGVDTKLTTMSLGIMLVAYSALGLANVRFRIAASSELRSSVLIGLIAGCVNSATGLFVLPVIPYLQSLEIDREELIQASALCFTVGSLALALRLHLDGTSVFANLNGSTLALGAALLGMPAGKALRLRASEQVFRRCFLSSLLVLGAALFAKAYF